MSMPAAMRDSYSDFLATKKLVVPNKGVDIAAADLPAFLFPFQADLVRWSIRKGRAALFADTGLGKTAMQLAWAQQVIRHTGDSPESPRVLILAPLAVARQTVAEGEKWGIPVAYRRNAADLPSRGIVITNYEMAEWFAPELFAGVVLDESSCLKDHEAKRRNALTAQWARTRWRLCCTATPAPNDIAEIANHAEFLGVMRRVDMLATFFVHDDAGWRLKGHAREAFYRWLASWGMSLRRPSDLGYADDGYALPPLDIRAELIPTDWAPPGQLFPTALKGITERSQLRKDTIAERVRRAAELIGSEPDEAWIAWCGLNDEQDMLAALLPDALSVTGSQSPDEKADKLAAFARGESRVLITKPSIAAWGLNFQHCARQVFVGIGDSYETYYQAIRRSWRFGQSRPVRVHVVLSEPEEAVYRNVLRKERDAAETAAALVRHVASFEKAEIDHMLGHQHGDNYLTGEARGDTWRILMGDSAERLKELDAASVDMAVFSPPFSYLFTYSPSDRDLGNCWDEDTYWRHFGFISAELLRVMKPGRNVCVHVSQLPLTKATHGVIGVRDFRGATIAHFIEAGFVYHGEICIDKDPQAQAIRTHSKGLLFTQLRKDSAWMRPAFADYILLFRAPGENAVPVHPDISNDEWIEWARPIWYGIKETDTLNAVEARENDDERHICPLQLVAIERCIRLWSNPGETILSPFAGIGSEVYQAVKLGRRGVGIELKPEYFKAAVKNVKRAEVDQAPMLALIEATA